MFRFPYTGSFQPLWPVQPLCSLTAFCSWWPLVSNFSHWSSGALLTWLAWRSLWRGNVFSFYFSLQCHITWRAIDPPFFKKKSQVKYIVLPETSLLEYFVNCYFIMWRIESNSITVHIIETLQPTMTKSSRTPEQSSYLGSFGRETLTHQTVSPLTRSLGLSLKQTLKQRNLMFQWQQKECEWSYISKRNKNVNSENLKVSKWMTA